MGPRKLCARLLAAASESEAVQALKEAGYWADRSAWRDFGDQPGNWAAIGNQQALPEAALVEKLVNSVDAVLMLECQKRGIDPTSSSAPHSIRDAVERFFNIRNGDFSDRDGPALTALASRISLIATGQKKAPNLTIADSGEGQIPSDFPDTLLSLTKQNKIRIQFVQGKFNMGGTGVLRFCGQKNLQLILSRRAPALVLSDWGFTIVRRDDPSGTERNSVFRYLAPEGNVLTFPAEKRLGLELDVSMTEETGIADMDFGTVIKLYEYSLSSGRSTNIVFDLFNRLNCLMPGLALPIRFKEYREYRGHTKESTLIGLDARLSRDTRDNLEFEPTWHDIAVSVGVLKCRVICFKRVDGKSGSEKFRDKEGVIFAVNGQAHGSLPKTVFARQRVGMSYLKDDILVLIDASRLDPRVREDLFLNSRDRLVEGPVQ
jgi:hypothetical protein